MRPSRLTLFLLLVGSLLTGLGCVALLPPFEGFDETAHYGYVDQLARTGHWPLRGDKITKVVDDYFKAGPAPEAMTGGISYPALFASDRASIEAARRAAWLPTVNTQSAPGETRNWQAQHPPLYYALLAPAFRLTEGSSLAGRLIVLRSLSNLMAWAGLCIVVVWATKSARASGIAPLLPLAVALWPALFPMWFPDTARLGNDSLIPLMAALTAILIWRVTASDKLQDHALLGFVAGLGMLTKATFLPVVAAVMIMLAFRLWTARRSHGLFAARLSGLLVCALICIVLGGWWYVAKYIETGSFIGSNDEIDLKAAGGLVTTLTNSLDLRSARAAPWALLLSFLWAGNWSFIQPPRVTLLPIALMLLLLGYGLWRHLRQHGLRVPEGFTLLALALFMGGVLQHSLVLLALTKNPAPAWYLHSLAPLFGLLVACGLAGPAQGTWSRRMLAVLMIYAPLFLLGVMALQVLFFAGCGPLMPGRRYIALADGMRCLADPARLYDNLAVIASPGIGFALFVVGWSALMTGTMLAARHLLRIPTPDAQPITASIR